MVIPRRSKDIRNFEDARHLAERRLPRFLYQKYSAGAGIGTTLDANIRAFSEIQFHPRAATFTPKRDLSTTAVGTPLSMPVMLAPVGALRLGNAAGECGAARAAAAAGTAAILSTSTGTPVEEVAAAAGGSLFYQLHYLGGRESAEVMIERAKAAGCRALVVTIDSQAPGGREQPSRFRAFAPDSFAVKDLVRVAPQVVRRPAWLYDFLRHPGGLELTMAPPRNGKPVPVSRIHDVLFERTPIWSDLDWIRGLWDGPLVVKGVLTAEDARLACDYGVDAIVVSNHGGNGLDGRPATLRSLPRVVAAVGDDAEVWLDGGVRRGTDVVKALALGARAVLIGRAYVFGLMAAGQRGVEQILELFRSEISHTLAFLECASVADLDPSHLEVPSDWTDVHRMLSARTDGLDLQ